MRLACRLQGYTLVVVRASSLLLTQLMAHGRWLRCWQHTAAPRRQRPRVRVAHCASGHCTELSAVIGMSPHLGAPPWTIERVELNKGINSKGTRRGRNRLLYTSTACCLFDTSYSKVGEFDSSNVTRLSCHSTTPGTSRNSPV